MRAILFDCFGVFARTQSPAGQALIESAAGVTDQTRAAFWRAFLRRRHDYDAGRIDKTEYWTQVAADAGLPFTPSTVRAAHYADLASWAGVDDTMTGYLADLHDRGHRIGLLSNVPHELTELIDLAPWIRYFDSITLSCRIGHAKPEPEAFTMAVSALGTDPSRTLFFDDSAPNVAAAAAAGLDAHVFVDAAGARVVIDAAD